MATLLKRTLLVSCFLAMAFAYGFAQEKGSHSYELGAGWHIPVNFAFLTCGGDVSSSGPFVYFEYRYAFANHFDVGGQLSYKYSNSSSEYTGGDCPTYKYGNNRLNLQAVTDYNICPTRLANPFIGITAGGGWQLQCYDTGINKNYFYGVLGLRLGVRVWHIKLTFNFDVTTEYIGNATGATLSYIF